MSKKHIRPPFNYIGGKYKLLDRLFKLFPTNIHTFYDVFGGGFSVGLNVEAKKVVYNELCEAVAGCVKHLCTTPKEQFMAELEESVRIHNLVDGGEEAYLAMRSKYNINDNNHVLFFTLFTHSFNSLIRFNTEGEFNAHWGGDHNKLHDTRRRNTEEFLDHIKHLDLTVLCGSFLDVPVVHSIDNFVYCDPPYLITKCDYMSNWGNPYEYALYHWLDTLSDKGVKFGLSNVLRSSGRYNHILGHWMQKYEVHRLDMSYSNASPIRKNRNEPDEEVFICNYKL